MIYALFMVIFLIVVVIVYGIISIIQAVELGVWLDLLLVRMGDLAQA